LLTALLTLGLAGCTLLQRHADVLPAPAAPTATASAAPGEPEGNAIDTAVSRSAAGMATVAPVVRSVASDGPAARMPYDTLASFLSKPLLLSAGQLRSAPHISQLHDDHVAVGAPHSVGIRGLAAAQPGRYAVVRAGEALLDPKSHALLGYMGIPIGTIDVQHTAAMTEGRLVESRREAQVGDLLFPEEIVSRQDFTLEPAPPGVRGEILAVVDGVSMIGQYQVVAVNRGSDHGLQVGQLLDISSANDSIGKLMVFKAYPRLSYGLTLSLLAPVRVAYQVTSP
jgi:hypothetical protein